MLGKDLLENKKIYFVGIFPTTVILCLLERSPKFVAVIPIITNKSS